MKSNYLVVVFLFCVSSVFAFPPNYLDKFDLKWQKVPYDWSEGAFIGNGEQGTMFFGEEKGGIRLDVGDTRIISGNSRTPIGKFVLKIDDGKMDDFTMQLSLSKAKITGSFNHKLNHVTFEGFTDIHSDLQRFLFHSSEPISIAHFPLPGIDANSLYRYARKFVKNGVVEDFTTPLVYDNLYKDKNFLATTPVEKTGEIKGVNFRMVPFSNKSGYVLLWKTIKHKKATEYVYTTHYFNDKLPEIEAVVANFENKVKTSYYTALKKHEQWWQQYYQNSYVNLPDARLEANYWLQIYKLGSAVKKNGLPLDLMGPWFRATPWPRIWCNFNLQNTYPIMSMANKKEQASSLFDFIDAHQNQFINAVPEEFRSNCAALGRGWSPYLGTEFSGETGNYLWLMYNYSQFLRMYPDQERTIQKYLPMLKRGVNFALTRLSQDAKGVFHFKAEISPEYTIAGHTFLIEDSTYNLSLLKWALDEVIYLSESNNIKDVQLEMYHFIKKQLAPISIDEAEGIMVGKDFKMEIDHRNFSHLLPIYPLGTMDLLKSEEKKLALTSVNHWLSRPNDGWGYRGYTYTGAAAMYARIDEGDMALKQLNIYFDKFMKPNTFYIEMGPEIETPMASGTSTLELLVQSYQSDLSEDKIKIFTSLPTDWKNVAFQGLKTYGGHTVSGLYVGGKINGIKLIGGSNRIVSLVLPISAKELPIYTSKKSVLRTKIQGQYLLIQGEIKQGEKIFIGDKKAQFENQINSTQYHFGLN